MACWMEKEMAAKEVRKKGSRVWVKEKRPLSDMKGLLPQAPLICPEAKAQGPHWPDLITMAHWPSQKAGRSQPFSLPAPSQLVASHPPVPCGVSHICTYWCFPTHQHSSLTSPQLIQGLKMFKGSAALPKAGMF